MELSGFEADLAWDEDSSRLGAMAVSGWKRTAMRVVCDFGFRAKAKRGSRFRVYVRTFCVWIDFCYLLCGVAVCGVWDPSSFDHGRVLVETIVRGGARDEGC